MKIGVLGSGVVGQTLASGFVKHGHDAMIGTREPAKLADWNKANPKARVGSPSQAGSFGEILVLAVKGHAAASALRGAGLANLKGKLIMDACNPIAEAPPVHGVLQFTTGPNESLMEQLQKDFADAHFVKVFNSVGAGQMINPQYPGALKPTMFICGNDEGAKKKVAGILEMFGWETADMGSVEAARAIEPLAMLWCILGFAKNEWTHAFKLLRK
jgi:predicted dinucleotide-binding enzyme